VNPPEAAPPATEQAGLRPARFWPAVLLFIITALLFLRATKAAFLVYDDTTFVTRNPHVTTGVTLDNLRNAFVGMDEVNWEPLTTISHMLDCQIFKLEPWGHHLVSILIHAFDTAGLFLLLRKLTGAQWRSFVVAALFGLHPLRVESVAWIAERKDVLCMTFWLLATWAYACYVERGKTPAARNYYRLCLLFFVLGIMSKPMMVTFPFFLMLLDYWPLKRVTADKLQPANLRPIVLDKIPLLLLTAMDCVITYLLQKNYGAVSEAIPFSARAANAVIGYARYLGKFFWPTKLAVLYPINDHWTAVQLVFAAALLIGISVFAFTLRKCTPWFFVGWFWFVGTLVPVIGLVQVGEQSIADRYTYIPMIGIALALVWGASEMNREWRGVWVAPLTALFVCYAVLTWRQLGYWADSHALFEHTVQVTENNYVANAILGDVYNGHGDPEHAAELFKEALRINPDFVPASEMLKGVECEQDLAYGKVLMRQGRYDQAFQQFQEAKQLRPANIDAHYSMGVIYKYKRQFPDAERELNLVLFLKPDSYQARRFLGYTLADSGQTEKALHEFEIAVKGQPKSFEAHSDMAKVLAATGRRKESIEQLKLALQLRPGDRTTEEHLAELQAMENR
jgi:tetratricopeptide (TPR) repeat protein